MLAIVGAGIGSLAGLLVSFVAGGWNPALVLGAVVGAILPLIFLGPPDR